MDNNLYDQNDSVEYCTGEVIATPAVPQHGVGAWMATYSCNAMRRNAQVEAEHNRCLAYLTQEALAYSGMLSSAEEKLNRVAPLGRDNYRAINQAFTEAAVKRIKEW